MSVTSKSKAIDAPLTEYQRSFIWRYPMSKSLPPPEKPRISEYAQAYKWPQNQINRPTSSHLSRNDSSSHKSPQNNSQNLTQVEREPEIDKSEVDFQGIKNEDVVPDAVINDEPINPEPVKEEIIEKEQVKIEDDAVLKPQPRMKKTEYKAKYRPFSQYAYFSGDSFKKFKHLNEQDSEKAKNWPSAMKERTDEAKEYRCRSMFGHPVYGKHLNEIYLQAALWDKNHQRENNDISLAALALATQMKIEDGRKEKQYLSSLKKSGK